jgi:hypothetical protein
VEETRQHPPVEDRQRRRLRGFLWHLLAYVAVIAVCAAINHMTNPGNPWFLLPLVGWGSVLALHVAYVMGLFRVFSGK